MIKEEQMGYWVPPMPVPDDISDYNASAGKSRGRSAVRSLSGDSKRGKSSMIDKEKAQLEKIKQRQQKEIEAMMENERRQEEIREKNKAKEQKEREREAKRQRELERKHQIQEAKKAQDDLKR